MKVRSTILCAFLTVLLGVSGAFAQSSATWETGSKVKWPSQAGNSGKCLTTNGSTVSWGDCGAGGGAPTNGPYITSTANGSLSAEVNLGLLTTGLLKITVVGGVATPSTASPGTDYQAASAALASLAGLTETNGGLPYGTADNAYAWLAAGGTGKILIAKGAAAPEWTPYTMPATVPTTGYGLVSDGTNMVATSSAFGTAAYTASTAYQAASATLASLAGLSETNGGIPYGTADNAYAWLAAGSANYLLQGNGAAAPTWTNAPTVSAANMTSFPTFNQNTTGTAAALTANGANCSAGYAPLGVDASGVVESCWQPQPIDAMLTALAALTSTEGSLVYFSGADTPVVLAKGTAYQNLRMNAGATALEWSSVVEWGKGTNIASAATVDLCTATGNVVDVTGATGPITSLGTCAAGTTRWVRFTGAPTITYNVTSMILPGARSVLVAAGDRAVFISLGSGNWYCASYLKTNGIALGDVAIISHGATEPATALSLYGEWHNITGAYVVTLPAGVVGMSATFNATTGATFSLDCNAADKFVLAGTALTAGNKITSSGLVGDQVEIVFTAANTWTVRHVAGIFIDGGA